MNPFFSVIIPVYNGEKFIERAINSVINQSYEKFEIIVIDNCSTDSTREIVNKLSNCDSRIKLKKIHQKGRSLARNYGIDKSIGNYILFLDADDEIKPELFKNLIGENFDFAYFKVNYISNNKVIKTIELPKENKIKKKIIYGNIFPINSVVISKKMIDKARFPENIDYCEDWYFWKEILWDKSINMIVKSFDFVGGIVNIHNNNTSSDNYLMKRQEYKYLVEFSRVHNKFNIVSNLRILSLANNPNYNFKKIEGIELSTFIKFSNKFLELNICQKILKSYFDNKKNIYLYDNEREISNE